MIPLIPTYTITRGKNPPKRPNGGTKTRSRPAQRTQDVNYPVVRFSLKNVNLLISVLSASLATLKQVYATNDFSAEGIELIYQATLGVESVRELIRQFKLEEHIKEYRDENVFVKLEKALKERMDNCELSTEGERAWVTYEECSHTLRQTEGKQKEENKK